MAINKGGRPVTVLNKEQIAEVEELAAYLTVEQIADYFYIDADTFLAIRKRQPEVFRLYKKGKVGKILRYTKKLDAIAMGDDQNGDTTAIIFFLKTQAGWSTNEKKKPTLKVLDSKDPIDIIDLAIDGWKNGNLSPQEAQQVGSLAMAKCNIEERTLANMHDNNDAHRTEEERKAELDLIRKGIVLKEEQARRQK